MTSIVEVGCGTAGWARVWRQAGVEYTGIELLPEVAAGARARTGATILTGDFVSMTDVPRADVLFCSQVLEHVASPMPFLRKAQEVAEVVHIDVPNQRSLTAAVRKLLKARDYGFIQRPFHLRAYTPKSLAHAMRQAGFDVSVCRGVANDDPTFGQLSAGTSFRHRAAYRVAEALGRGSLLMVLGRRGHAACSDKGFSSRTRTLPAARSSVLPVRLAS